MRTTATIYVTRYGNVRLTKTRSSPKPAEVAVDLTITVPDRYFQRPVPLAKIDLPDFGHPDWDKNAAVDVTAETVAESLGLNVDDVRAGLQRLLNRDEEA